MMEIDSPAETVVSSRLRICATKEDDNDSEVRSIFNDRVPFSATNSKNDLKYFKTEFEKAKYIKISNKENCSNRSPRVRHQDQMESSDSLTGSKSSKNEINNNGPCDSEVSNVTSGNTDNRPLTPTANLKMLFNAVSQVENEQSRHSDSPSDIDVCNDTFISDSKPDFFTNSEFDNELMSSQESECGKTGSRKEKSLGLLCQKFLQKYKEYPDPADDAHICLDEIAKELNTERRRIYDIVNVLESVEIVSRLAKNKYLWHGKSNLHTTLAKLKALAENEGFAEQITKVKDFEFNRELEAINGKTVVPSQKDINDLFGAGSLLRKDKSLGIMSQKFLMLFLVSKPKIVNLDLAAKILIGDPTVDRTENAKFKTKIRRLYDIANILSSLELICKVHVTEIRGRKPAFKYIGPDVDCITDIPFCASDGHHRPSSRHSLLDCIKNKNLATIVSKYRTIKPNTIPDNVPMISPVSSYASPQTNESEKKKSFIRHASFDQICKVAERERSKVLVRHSSFDEICAVAEKERNKLVLSGSLNVSRHSRLLPSSTQGNNACEKVSVNSSKATQVQENAKTQVGQKKHYILMQKEGQFHLLDNKNIKITPTSAKSITPESGSSAENQAESNKPIRAETIIIKTKNIHGLQKNSPVILTEEQIAAVLKSLKNPVKVSKIACNSVDASTQSSPLLTSEEKNNPKDLKDMNERTPIPTLSSVDNPSLTGKHKLAVENKNLPEVKKIKIELLTPPSDVATKYVEINKTKEKPSSKALHLVPEFMKTQTCRKISYSDTDLASPLSDEDSNDSVKCAPGQKVLEKNDSAFRRVCHQRSCKSTDKKCDSLDEKQLSVVPLSDSSVDSFVKHSIGQSVDSSNHAITLMPYSPPITPNNPSSQKNTFSFPTSQAVHIVHPTPIKISSSSSISQSTSILSPENKNIVLDKLTPTPTTFFGSTPSTSARTFLPIQQSSCTNVSDDSDVNGGTARKLNML